MDKAIRSHRALWRAVVCQAFTDMLAPAVRSRAARSKEKYAQVEWHRAKARRWLLSGSRDLHEVCFLAGLDAYEISRIARLTIMRTAECDEAKLRAYRRSIMHALNPVHEAPEPDYETAAAPDHSMRKVHGVWYHTG